MAATPGESAEWEGGSRQDVARAQRSMDAPFCAVPLDIPH
jgi:hypothetical protein